MTKNQLKNLEEGCYLYNKFGTMFQYVNRDEILDQYQLFVPKKNGANFFFFVSKQSLYKEYFIFAEDALESAMKECLNSFMGNVLTYRGYLRNLELEN